MSPFRRILACLAVAALAVGCATTSTPAPAPLESRVQTAAQAGLTPHPRQLEFEPLDFEVPRAEPYRHELSNGVVVYVVEDHDLPLVDIHVTARIGSFLEPEDHVGLASLTGEMMRQGGTETMTAEELDERVDFLAAGLSSAIGDTSGSFHLDSLSTVLDETLPLLFDVIAHPRFQESRLEVAKSDRVEAMKQRNDDPAAIAAREWQQLMYGPDHFTSREPTQASIEAISREDLVAFHRGWLNPTGMVIAVSGDVETAAILAALEAEMAHWDSTQAGDVPWPPPGPDHTPQPGLYQVEKDIPQGRVQIGHLGMAWDDWSDPAPRFAAMVMNDVLGGGGFTSRITQRIRSDEGLAYSAGSRFGIGTWWEAPFVVSFQSKNPTVGYAAQIAVDELRRIQQEPVTAEELQTAKSSFIETFPRGFETAESIADRYANDAFVGRPHSYWYEYRDRIRAVDAAAVQAVAREELHPDRLVALVVAPWDQVSGAEADPRGSIEAAIGPVIRLPLRDPLTLEPLSQTP